MCVCVCVFGVAPACQVISELPRREFVFGAGGAAKCMKASHEKRAFAKNACATETKQKMKRPSSQTAGLFTMLGLSAARLRAIYAKLSFLCDVFHALWCTVRTDVRALVPPGV